MDEVVIRADGSTLTLSIGDYERSQGMGHDANWLRGTVTLERARPHAGGFRARCDVAWNTSELLRFFEALRTLLDDLTGTAQLTTLEDQVEVKVELRQGKGTIIGRVEEHAVASLEFEDSIDQSQLNEPLAALRRVVGKYPVRP
jgi:hypothetical protein